MHWNQVAPFNTENKMSLFTFRFVRQWNPVAGREIIPAGENIQTRHPCGCSEGEWFCAEVKCLHQKPHVHVICYAGSEHAKWCHFTAILAIDTATHSFFFFFNPSLCQICLFGFCQCSVFFKNICLFVLLLLNTFRPGYLYVSNRDACCVAELLVNK